MIHHQFVPKNLGTKQLKGTTTWEAPSNIALVKYWGKKEPQIPMNTSLSFTLSESRTITTLSYKPKKGTEADFEVWLDNELKEDFKPKIKKFLSRVNPYLPFLEDYDLKIETTNTFPHSSGIASSASGMAALSLCLMQMELELNPEMDDAFFRHKASFLARLGSGSACRSLSGGIVVWGEHPEIPGSSDLYGIGYPLEIDDVFNGYKDAILIVEEGQKQVSSTLGHSLMDNHPFAEQRFSQANDNIEQLIHILEIGDLEAFVNLVESEALSLHAMMMTSDPNYLLMKPNTLAIINKIWEFRRLSGIMICFTLDAGANVHLLYPDSYAKHVKGFIERELLKYCQNKKFIQDEVGIGPRQL